MFVCLLVGWLVDWLAGWLVGYFLNLKVPSSAQGTQDAPLTATGALRCYLCVTCVLPLRTAVLPVCYPCALRCYLCVTPAHCGVTCVDNPCKLSYVCVVSNHTRVYRCLCVCACVHACVLACVRACVRARARACVRACVCVGGGITLL